MSSEVLTAEVKRLTTRVDELLTLLGPALTTLRSGAAQAKAAGCHRTTLWRRRQRAAARVQAANLRP